MRGAGIALNSRVQCGVVVLGAGISGLTTAYFLASEGHEVVVVDDYPAAGGNHLSAEFGPGSFDIGTIFFAPDDPQFSLFPGLRDVCLPVSFSVSRIAPDGVVRHYPFSLNEELLSRSPVYVLRALASAAVGRIAPRRDRTAADYLRRHIGTRIAEDSGLMHYIERLYSVPAHEIDISFAHRRMTWIAAQAQFGNVVRRLGAQLARGFRRGSVDLAAYPPQSLARPRAGFAIYYDKILETLRGLGVSFRLSAGIEGIAPVEGGLELRTRSGAIRAPRMVNSAPLPIVYRWLGWRDSADVTSNRLTTLCCSFVGARGFREIVLYNFDRRGTWKRLTMHSDYYGSNAGREYFGVEVTELESHRPVEELFDDFRRHVCPLGLFDGDLRLEGHLALDHAYPLYRLGAEAARETAIKRLAEVGIESVGRQGRFDYLPTSRLAVELVRDAYGSPVGPR
jgi:protoporphyrinogen oxidase